MDLTYNKEHARKRIENMEAVQDVLSASGAIVDSKILPLIDEAEKGNIDAMADLYEMFVYGDKGDNRVTPNFTIAKRYWMKLYHINLEEGDPQEIFLSLNSYARMLFNFEQDDWTGLAFLNAFKYMIANLTPQQWDWEIIQLFADNQEGYQEVEYDDDDWAEYYENQWS